MNKNGKRNESILFVTYLLIIFCNFARERQIALSEDLLCDMFDAADDVVSAVPSL